MISAYKNCFRIPELRNRLVFTFCMIAICRLASVIPCPGVDPAGLAEIFKQVGGNRGTGGVMDMLDLFSGGAMENFAVGALGIMPYISASIILQLLTPVIPQLERMIREGESGRQKHNQIMRYVTLAICVIQGAIFGAAMMNPDKLNLPSGVSVVTHPGFGFMISTIITLTAGAMFIMWIGEMITEKGIGNGASLIITVNIIARLPRAISSFIALVFGGAATGDSDFTVLHMILLLAMFLVVCAGAVALTQGHRRIPIRYARRVMGVGGSTVAQTSYLPLRVNYSGVMPIIFAGAILSFPMLLMRFLPMNAFTAFIAKFFQTGTGYYLCLYAIMILLFSFFWVANQFNPIQIADDLQRQGGYIPGIRPGQPTAEFLDHSMTRITLAGAIFLLVLAILPMVLSNSMQIPYQISQFFGGTSLLIIVGVSLDTMRQIEGYLLSYHYDGFMEKGHLRSRQ